MNDDRPRKRAYARIERERRFLLSELPSSVDLAAFERLRDLYIDGTHLRLRRIEAPAGDLILAKLGQKIADPDAPDNPRHRQMTTLYLEPAEADVVAVLPGRRSVKRRYRLFEQGRTFVVDVYEQPQGAAGIMLAEVECDSDVELDAIETPAWAIREVTDEARWSGARLAQPPSA